MFHLFLSPSFFSIPFWWIRRLRHMYRVLPTPFWPIVFPLASASKLWLVACPFRPPFGVVWVWARTVVLGMVSTPCSLVSRCLPTYLKLHVGLVVPFDSRLMNSWLHPAASATLAMTRLGWFRIPRSIAVCMGLGVPLTSRLMNYRLHPAASAMVATVNLG